MPVKDTREYRLFGFDEFEARGGGYNVEGYAAIFEQPYVLYRDSEYGDVSEIIRAGCLDNADMGDVIFQYNHEGLVMARTRNGSLSVEADARGIHIRADLGGTEQGRQIHEAIRNGLVDSMSWGFEIAKDGCDFDAATRTMNVRRVSKIFDVSAVSIPANPGTSIQTRSFLNGAIEAGRQELAQRERNLGLHAARLRLAIPPHR